MINYPYQCVGGRMLAPLKYISRYIISYIYISRYNYKCDLILKTKAFTDVIKLRKGDHSGVRWALNPLPVSLSERKAEGVTKQTQRHREDDHVKTEAEVGVMQPRAKEGHEPPKAGKSQGCFAPRAFRGSETRPALSSFPTLGSRAVRY